MIYRIGGIQTSALHITDGDWYIRNALFQNIIHTNPNDKGGAIKAGGAFAKLVLTDVMFDTTGAESGGGALYCNTVSQVAFTLKRVCATNLWTNNIGVAMYAHTAGNVDSEYTTFTAINLDNEAFHLNYLTGSKVTIFGYNATSIKLKMYAVGLTTMAKCSDVNVSFSNFKDLVCNLDMIEVYESNKTTYRTCNLANNTCTEIAYRFFLIAYNDVVVIEDCILSLGTNLQFDYYGAIAPDCLLVQNCVLDKEIVPALHLTGVMNTLNEANCDLKYLTFLSTGHCEAGVPLIRPTLTTHKYGRFLISIFKLMLLTSETVS